MNHRIFASLFALPLALGVVGCDDDKGGDEKESADDKGGEKEGDKADAAKADDGAEKKGDAAAAEKAGGEGEKKDAPEGGDAKKEGGW